MKKVMKILLSANTRREFYIDAVEACGGIADALYCPEYSSEYDGLILCGGNDINPKLYGEEINGAIDIDDRRDMAEIKLARAFIEAGKPILGICRGSQLLNAIFGGTLCQHLPCTDKHRSDADLYPSHGVTAVKGSACERLYGGSFTVNSAHHQAVKALGEGLCAVMYSDEVIEGFEHESLPIIGIQWHPERMCCGERREDTVDGIEVFKYFLSLCEKHRSAKSV